jgi:hypothetical protein
MASDTGYWLYVPEVPADWARRRCTSLPNRAIACFAAGFGQPERGGGWVTTSTCGYLPTRRHLFASGPRRSHLVWSLAR